MSPEEKGTRINYSGDKRKSQISRPLLFSNSLWGPELIKKKKVLKISKKTHQTLQEYGFDLFSQPASQDPLQCGYTCKVQSHFSRSEVLIKHSRFFKGSQQVGKQHLPECNITMQGIWMDATFWHEMTGRALLSY